MALKKGASAQKLFFSKTWTPSRIILRLSAGPLVLVNVMFLVSDAELAVEKLRV